MSKWVMPLAKYKYGPLFGVVDSWHPNGHRGTDYNGFGGGTKLFAVSDGIIAENKWSDGLGNVVVLKVNMIVKGEKSAVFFGYAHLHKPSPLKVGTKVKAGDVIGGAGTTGKFSSGVHLHFTLGMTKDAVFAGKVYDADAFVKRQIKASAGKPAAKVAAPAAPAVKKAAPAVAPAAAKPASPSAPVSKLVKPTLKGELKTGSKGDAVKYLQQQLGLKIDGVFGPTTHTAVVAFQKKRKDITKPDGIVGQLTWKAIN